MERPNDHAEIAIKLIDDYFKADAELSEESKLHDGLVSAVDKGWMTQEEAEACERAYHLKSQTE